MGQEKVLGDQLNILDVASDISNDSTAIGDIAAGIVNDPAAQAAITAGIDHAGLIGVSGSPATYTHTEIDAHIDDTTIHFTEASIDHANIIGGAATYIHTDIDTHIDDNSLHFNTLDGLTDVQYTGSPSPLSSQVLTWTGSFWEPITPTDVSAIWGNISGTLSDQTDLNSALGLKLDIATFNVHSTDPLIHFEVGTIDHDSILNNGVNTHPQLDAHLTNTGVHYTQGAIVHQNISGVGANDHVAIDNHIADTSIHFSVLGGLSDVDTTGAVNAMHLTYDGATWIPQLPSPVNNWISANSDNDFVTAPNTGTSNYNDIAIGNNAQAFYAAVPGDPYGDNIAIGTNSQASATYNIAVGYKSQATAYDSIAIGKNSTASHTYSISIGHYTKSGADKQLNIGPGIYGDATEFRATFGYGDYAIIGVQSPQQSLVSIYGSGKLELYGDEAQYVLPNYLVGSPPTNPLPLGVEGGMVWDSSKKELNINDGTSWNVVGGVTNPLTSDLDTGGFSITGTGGQAINITTLPSIANINMTTDLRADITMNTNLLHIQKTGGGASIRLDNGNGGYTDIHPASPAGSPFNVTSKIILPNLSGAVVNSVLTLTDAIVATTEWLPLPPPPSTTKTVEQIVFSGSPPTTYDLQLGDAEKYLISNQNNVGGVTIGILDDATVAFPVGTQIEIAQLGSEIVSIEPSSLGATITSQSILSPNPHELTQYQTATLTKIGANNWLITYTERAAAGG